MATLKDSTESLSTAVWGRRSQSTMVWGGNGALLCWVLHNGTWYNLDCMFLGWWKFVTFTDYHLVLGNFIHYDNVCICASIPKAVPFKIWQHVTNTGCISCLLATYLAALRWTISIFYFIYVKCKIGYSTGSCKSNYHSITTTTAP